MSESVSDLNSERAQKVADRSNRLGELALAYVATNGPTSVARLHHALKLKNPSLTEYETADLIWRLDERGKIRLEDVPPVTNSLREYLGFWERNLWFYLSLAVSYATVIVVYAVPDKSPFVIVRWVLGSVFVLFMPGYVTVEALFPKDRDLDTIERFALSVGSSLALAPLIGLLLNYTPWGIRLTPIVISLTLFSVGVSVAALYRQFRLVSRSTGAKRLT